MMQDDTPKEETEAEQSQTESGKRETEEHEETSGGAMSFATMRRAIGDAARAGNTRYFVIRSKRGDVLFRGSFTVLALVLIALIPIAGIGFRGLLAIIGIFAILLVWSGSRVKITRDENRRNNGKKQREEEPRR